MIEWFEDDRVELYNVVDDIGEQHELSKFKPKIVNQLRDDLHAWQKQVSAKFPIKNSKYDAAKPSGRAAERKKDNSQPTEKSPKT